MKNQFKLIHLFYILFLILALGYFILWVFHLVIPNPFPNTEFYLLIVIYLIVTITTAYIFKTKDIKKVHQQIGFNKIQPRYFFIALFGVSLIWVFDYYLNFYLFKTDTQNKALEWYQQNKQVSIVFVTSVILVPIIEEMIFRGLLLQTLNNYINKFWSAIIVSGLFTLVHFDPVLAIALFTASMFFVWLTYKSKSIIPAISAHILNNFITFVFYLSYIN